jgi:acetylornithine deacetylase/succinyl-diaminopimelate desuccinylase-like protein
MLEQALQAARDQREQSQADLFELIRIPSVSALTEHDADCRQAAQWIVDRLDAAGMAVELVDVPGEGRRHPVITAEWTGAGPQAPTLAIYGHYDVQPPDPLDEWQSPPFEPSVRDGFVYARGADDNKGQIACGIRAAELALANGGPPVNLRFLIEGEEEVGGPSLPEFVKREAARLHTDYLFIADGQFTAPDLPNLLTGLRGLLYTEVEAVGAAADLHSGIYGGVAPNPLNTLAHVISSLKGRDGRVTVPGFYDAVRAPDPRELADWQRLPVTEEDQKQAMGVPALEGEVGFSPLERRWARPTLDVHGILGGFQGEGQKTVIPARAKAKISMRLVPDQDPDRIFDTFAEYIDSLTTPGVRVSARRLSSGRAVRTGTDHPGVEAAARAFEAAYGGRPVLVREGGSIPVTVEFQEALHPHLLVTGFGLPGDALHAPNEKYSLDQYFRGIEMVLHLMENLRDAPGA